MALSATQTACAIIVSYGKAIQAYLRKLVSRNAPFDQYVATGGGNLSASAINGATLFVGKAKCTLCHSGPFLTDNQFHNLGGLGPDDGRFTDAATLKASSPTLPPLSASTMKAAA